MNYLLIGLLALAVAAALLLNSRRARAQPSVSVTTSASVPTSLPAGPLIVNTLAGHPTPAPYADGRGAAARFVQLRDLAVDRQGNVWVADQSTIRCIAPNGEVRTVAGYPPGPRGESQGPPLDFANHNKPGQGDGPAAKAQLSVKQLTIGPDGAVYFTDGSRVRRLSRDGQVTTLAGIPGYTYAEGYTDGPGVQARFRMPHGLLVAADGTVYVADTGNNCIRRISPAGVVSTLAGLAGEYGGVNGRGAAARFDHPSDMTWAPDGALLVYDGANNCIRRVSLPEGEVSTWLGSTRNAPRGTDPRARLDLYGMEDFAVDAQGTAYFTPRHYGHDHIIRRILPDGSEPVSPWAGHTDYGGHLDAATPGAARFHLPKALAFGPDGTLYVADWLNNVVRAISPSGVVTTLAGQPPLTTPDGQGVAATLGPPTGLALEPDGSLLVTGGGLLQRISPTGAVTTLAGAFPAPPKADAAPTALHQPYGVAVVGGVAYVSDEARHVIYRVDGPQRLMVWAGKVDTPGDNNGSRARFDQPTALVAGPDGSLYTADREGHAIRRISPRGQVSLLSGERKKPVGPLSNEGRYVSASAVAVGPDGAVYLLQGALRRYPPGGGPPVVLAGSDDNEPGYADGRGAAVRFNRPTGLCVAADGTVYVADRGNHLIRQVGPDGAVTTVAGQPGVHPLLAPGTGPMQNRYAPDNSDNMAYASLGDYRDGPAATARFHHPSAVALGADGVLYVADEDNNCIRTVRPAVK